MKEFDEFCEVVATLRSEEGCPWDRKQTHMSLKKECIEEAAEVICGINILNETNNADNLREELGDMLLQVVMHSQIAKEEGLFTIEDVIRDIKEKMIRRHPHVFDVSRADTEYSDAKLREQWQDIKKDEKAGKEWMESYLPAAFDESAELLKEAKIRKLDKMGKKGV